MTIRVILADDQALLRATFRLLLDSTEDLQVVAEAATGAEAVRAAHVTPADVIVMDLRMPDMDGIDATHRITSDPALEGVKVLVLTTFETDELILAALRAGASAFLGKGVDPEDLISAIRTVAAGEQLLSPVATKSLIERVLAEPVRSPGGVVPGIQDLTDREREIAILVAAGLSNTEIAQRLFISPATAKTHVNRAMAKTGARDRAQLVVIAYEAGLAQPAKH